MMAVYGRALAANPIVAKDLKHGRASALLAGQAFLL